MDAAASVILACRRLLAQQTWTETEARAALTACDGWLGTYTANLGSQGGMLDYNTVKERLRALRFGLCFSEYTTSFKKLVSDARVAGLEEFSQDDLKTWYLDGLRHSSNELGEWIADKAVPVAMAIYASNFADTKFTWSDVTLPYVQEGAHRVYEDLRFSSERPPQLKNSVIY